MNYFASILFGILVSALLTMPTVGQASNSTKLITCKLEGKALDIHRLAGLYKSGSRDAQALEYVLYSTQVGDELTSPSRFSLKTYLYMKDESDKIVRKGTVGAPLTRVGYSVLNDVHTFSYTKFSGSDSPAMQVSTDGTQTVVSYSQSGSGRRKYTNTADCEIHAEENINAPDIDISDLTREEKVELMGKLRYRQGVSAREPKLDDENKKKEMLEYLVSIIDEKDFADSVDTADYEWDGCGELVRANSYGYRRIIYDYQANVLGYVLEPLMCSNKIIITHREYDRRTGEPIDKEEERTVRVSNVFVDGNLWVLNTEESNNYPISIRSSRW